MACRRLWLWLIAAAVPFSLLVGFVSTKGAANDKPSATTGRQAVPPDYRELIARALLEKTDLQKIRHAKITRPGLSYEGGVKRPVACARLTIQHTKGERELHTGFTFQDGQIDEVFNPDFMNPMVGAARAAVARYGQHSCESHSYVPFPELLTSTK